MRYADDFVVLTQTQAQAEEVRTQVACVLGQLGLTLSPEKTRVTTYGKGHSFLGFVLSCWSRRMRPKSVEKFRDKVQELTQRKLNFDATVINQLNRVIRGTAQYFAVRWSTQATFLRDLDSWIRMRLRAQRQKRKRKTDNYRLLNGVFTRLGLLSLSSFLNAPSSSH